MTFKWFQNDLNMPFDAFNWLVITLTNFKWRQKTWTDFEMT